jgi:hypothetical protein
MNEVEVMKKETEFQCILNTLPHAETHCNILEVCTSRVTDDDNLH